jgi:hypothetical protein
MIQLGKDWGNNGQDWGKTRQDWPCWDQTGQDLAKTGVRLSSEYDLIGERLRKTEQ